jgi:hypothetical protein
MAKIGINSAIALRRTSPSSGEALLRRWFVYGKDFRIGRMANPNGGFSAADCGTMISRSRLLRMYTI